MVGNQTTHGNRTINELLFLSAQTQRKLSNDVLEVETDPKLMSQAEIDKKLLRLLEKLAIDNLFGDGPWPMNPHDKAALALALEQHGLYVPVVNESWTWELVPWAYEFDIELLLTFAGFWVDSVIVTTLENSEFLDVSNDRSGDAWKDWLRSQVFRDGAVACDGVQRKLRIQTQIAYFRFCQQSPRSKYRYRSIMRAMVADYERRLQRERSISGGQDMSGAKAPDGHRPKTRVNQNYF